MSMPLPSETASQTADRPGVSPEPLGPRFDPLSARRVNQLVWGLIAVGIAARLVRYLLRFPLWQDEAYLATSFLDRGYLELMEPLENRQVAPLLFLWVQHAVIQLLGFTEYSLRLFPLVCGVGSVLLFPCLARRLLKGTALVLAVGLLAVSYSTIRYSVEAKQYSCDLFVSLGLLVLAVEWWRRPDRLRWLWILTAVVPLAVGLSYPAVFTAGGISLAAAVTLWRRGGGRGWAAWCLYNLVLVGSFGALFALSAAGQSGNARDFLLGLWHELFPPLTSPLRLVGWLLSTHTGDMCPYPLGGARGASTLTFVCCVVAVVFLVRRRRTEAVLLMLAPLAVNFVAACLHRYPYGGPVRFAIYAAPMICLLAGLGAALLLIGNGKRPRQARAQVSLVLLLLAVLGLGSAGRDLCKPYKTTEVLRSREVARSLWRDRADQTELVCLLTDLGDDFSSRPCPTVLALYLCNQRIYSARHARGERPRLDRVSARRPLCCVHFRSPAQKPDEQRLTGWLKQMQSQYRLAGREQHAVPVTYDKRPLPERVDVYRFEPVLPAVETQISRAGSGKVIRR